jgi:hypothetical protein
VTSILVHGAAAAALFFLLEELLLAFGTPPPGRRWLAFLTAFIWAVHPVHTSAVVYISGRADPLAALFGFLGCCFALRHLRAPGMQKFLWLCASAGLLLLAALSKETGLIFPVLAIALFGFLKDLRSILKMTAVAAFIAAVYFSLRLGALHHPAPVTQVTPPISVRAISATRAVAEYAGLLALPLNLHMERGIDIHRGDSVMANMQQSAAREFQTILGLGLITAAGTWALRLRQREPIVSFALVLAAIAYLPVSGIVILNATVAEHWIYLPSAFLFLAGGATLTRLIQQTRKWRLWRPALFAGLACWVAFFCVRTCLRTLDWKDQRTFLQATVAQGGDSARMLINLAGLESSEGRLEAAKQLSQRALQKSPDQPMAVISLATVALKQNDFKTSRELALRATKMEIVDAQAHELLAVLEHKEKGRVDLMRLRLASRTGPPNWAIEKRYVQLMDEMGSTNGAIRELQARLRTEWYRAESWQMLAHLLRKTGQTSEAATAQSRAAAYDVHLGRRGVLL